jgi:hypothetical protein
MDQDARNVKSTIKKALKYYSKMNKCPSKAFERVLTPVQHQLLMEQQEMMSNDETLSTIPLDLYLEIKDIAYRIEKYERSLLSVHVRHLLSEASSAGFFESTKTNP